MLIAVYQIKQEHPTVYQQVKGKHKWLIILQVSNNLEVIKKEIRNQKPITLSDLLPTAHKELHQMWQELSSIVDARFSVHLLR